MKEVDFRNTASEHSIQKAFFDWVNLMKQRDSRFNLIFGVPNAAKRSPGVARRMLEEGLTAGVADVLGLIPNKKYAGFAIEFKRVGGKLSKEQISWLREFEANRHKVCVSFTVEDAIAFTTFYLKEK